MALNELKDNILRDTAQRDCCVNRINYETIAEVVCCIYKFFTRQFCCPDTIFCPMLYLCSKCVTEWRIELQPGHMVCRLSVILGWRLHWSQGHFKTPNGPQGLRRTHKNGKNKTANKLNRNILSIIWWHNKQGVRDLSLLSPCVFSSLYFSLTHISLPPQPTVQQLWCYRGCPQL